MDSSAPQTSFGVFKPVGHVLIQLPSADDLDGAVIAVLALGPTYADMVRYTPRQMLTQIDQDLASASPLAGIGQELNLIKAHRVMAEQGYHWLLVKVPNLDMARRVADAVRPWHAERAQHYGRFLIDELIEHAGDTTQVAESPDRGLDAQTPSGQEAERGERHT
ncbi:hypothetical protein [Aquabacterium sp.]|uniref:hypothetical protein n=1 Tax=Aquabacterium sp. TaxID=1872578 RepID=UPI002BCDDB58|nr:hypothetical protein [Aquabacterium sp.]HSW04813.1 hypothetical protein [Aquabacterium sp.]